MEDINKYVGIPHYFNQDSFDGCDCIGLCRLFYKEHGWKQDFKDGKPITKDWQKTDGAIRLFRYFKQNFKETKNLNELSFGDIRLFDVAGDYHFGISLEYGKVLGLEVPVRYGKSISTVYHKKLWINGFVSGFKRKND